MTSKTTSIIVLFVGLVVLGVLLRLAPVPLAGNPPGVTSPTPTFWVTVQQSAKWIAEILGPMAVTVAGVGTATMASFQAVKDLFYVRRWYNRRRVDEWLRTRAGDGLCAEHARESLETLATAGDGDALYSLEIDKLAAQMALAGRMALDRPGGHKALIACLTKDAPNDDVTFATSDAPHDPSKRPSYLEAKNRVASYMQRSIDGFKVMADYRWTHLNQVIVFLLNSAFFLLLWLLWSRSIVHFVSAIGAALLGGFIAPVAKDLVTALQSLKDMKR